MLTQKQSETLDFIKRFIKVHGYAPSLIEIGHGLKLASKSGVHRLLTALEERGHIRRIPNRNRAIEVIENPTLDHGLRAYTLAELVREIRSRGLFVGSVVQEIHHAQGESDPVVKRRFKIVTEEDYV